jgi:hypothetical protein
MNAPTHAPGIRATLGAAEPRLRPIAYRVTRDLAGSRYVIRDPFGAAIDGVSTLERALEIAAGLAMYARERSGETFDC